MAGPALALDVWDPSRFREGSFLAVIDGAIVRAARVSAGNQPTAVTLAGAGAVAGAQDILAVNGTCAFAGTFTVNDEVLTVVDAVAAGALAGMTSALVMPWNPTPTKITGRMAPGNVRIPNDHENAALELTRHKAVLDHELTHTLQAAKWGPLFLAIFPLWAVELASDLSAAGGPQFSPYGDGTLKDGALTFADAAGLSAGDTVQVAQNRRAELIKLDTIAGAVARLGDDARSKLSAMGMTDGPVKVRRQNGGDLSGVLEWVTNIGQLLTMGGALNNLTLTGWGGIAALVTLAISSIRGATRSKTVMSLAADRKTLDPRDTAHLDGLRVGVLVAVKHGDAIVVRTIASMDNATITLDTPTPDSATGPGAGGPVDVELSIYSPGSALFGLRDYYTARMPDANEPARLSFTGAGGKPTLAVHDRIDIRTASGQGVRTLVTKVDGDQIEFADALLGSASDTNEYLVAKIASQDPTGWLDAWLLDTLNIGWMQYAFDPWGHIIAGHMPDRSNIAGQVFARSARYLFSTQSWALPFLGYFFLDDAFRRDHASRSQMEQEAAHRSGDTYSPLGSLHGETAVIGDVGRYWLTVSGGTRDSAGTDNGGLVVDGRQDAPGVSLRGLTIKNVKPATGVAPAFSGTKSNGEFDKIASAAWIPVSADLERSAGINFAFTRPPDAGDGFKLDADGTVADLKSARDAQDNGAATLSFDLTPKDVTVTAAGQAVAEAATVKVVPFQRVSFTVAPGDGGRVYRATVCNPGAVFDTADLKVTARGAFGSEHVEISRFHARGSLTTLHLPDDIDIAVRRFEMDVGQSLPLRAPHTPSPLTFSHLDAAALSAKPGDTLFLLVPAPFAAPLVTSAFAGTLPVTPVIGPAAASSDPQVIEFLGDGGALKVELPADQPPEAAADLTLTVPVGPPGSPPVNLTAVVSITPHFTLDGTASAKAGKDVTLTASGGESLAEVGTRPAGIADVKLEGAKATVTLAAGLEVGSRITLLLGNAAKPGQNARRNLTVA